MNTMPQASFKVTSLHVREGATTDCVSIFISPPRNITENGREKSRNCLFFSVKLFIMSQPLDKVCKGGGPELKHPGTAEHKGG